LNSLKGRILLAFGLFLFLFGLATIFALASLKDVSRIRDLQFAVADAQKKTLTLINRDLILRTDETIKHDFYRDPAFPAKLERKELFLDLKDTLDYIRHQTARKLIGREDLVSSIIESLESYDSVHNEIMNLQLTRGFKDDGLEGEMRTFIHELENYQDQVPLSELLSLRRHEKDYFLRSDTLYVQELRELSIEIIRRIGHTERGLQARLLLEGYTTAFNSVVILEEKIGDHDRGAISQILATQNALAKDFEILNSQAGSIAEQFVRSRIRIYFQMTLACFIVSALFGLAMSHYASVAINKLAQTMQKSLASGKMEVAKNPLKHPSWETASLYNSYSQLLTKINDQMIQLEESNDVKEKFLSIIGHDLKGPMATMMMMINILVEDINRFNETETREFANRILKSANRISLLMENLLAWSRSQADKLNPERETVSVLEVAAQNSNLYELKLKEKAVSLIIDVPEGLSVLADRNMFDFVIRNLFDNATKFTKPSGEILVNATSNKEVVAINIKDNGLGISKSQQKTLFNSVSKRSEIGTSGEKGTGLGLVLCAEFIRRNNGKLTVKSKEGQGTVFTVTLPMA